jgi:predicted transcriptional regulator
MTSTTPITDEIRERRERLRVSRLTLAVRAGVSPSWVAALEAGLRPQGDARTRVLRALDELERGWQLEPGVGRSGYRADTDRPEAA